jgi:hypothetical protein
MIKYKLDIILILISIANFLFIHFSYDECKLNNPEDCVRELK